MSQSHFDFIVGTFNTPCLFTLRFTPPSNSGPNKSQSSLQIIQKHSAVGSHSWLHLTPPSQTSHRALYATAWTDPPTLAAYSLNNVSSSSDSYGLTLISTVRTASRSGYVTASNSHVYSAGGASGEVYAINPVTGVFVDSSTTSNALGSTTSTYNSTDSGTTNNSISTEIPPLQTLSFLDKKPQIDSGSTLDFGGLRHGAHSADLSPDGSLLYVADIGRNCIWVLSVLNNGQTQLATKHLSPRPNDGPRHVWPHPNGRIVYVLQEHTSIVDVFEVIGAGVQTMLKHRQGVKIIPADKDPGKYWADEVRLSLGFDHGDVHGVQTQTNTSETAARPKYMYASTRGLEPQTKGYVCVYALQEDGLIAGARLVDSNNGNESGGSVPDDDQGGLLCMYETHTSGGWANAIQPGPTVDGIEYVSLTDSEEGLVFVLGWDGSEVREIARVNLSDSDGEEGRKEEKVRHGAATAVWL